jgi:hypothetical protein
MTSTTQNTIKPQTASAATSNEDFLRGAMHVAIDPRGSDPIRSNPKGYKWDDDASGEVPKTLNPKAD